LQANVFAPVWVMGGNTDAGLAFSFLQLQPLTKEMKLMRAIQKQASLIAKFAARNYCSLKYQSPYLIKAILLF